MIYVSARALFVCLNNNVSSLSLLSCWLSIAPLKHRAACSQIVSELDGQATGYYEFVAYNSKAKRNKSKLYKKCHMYTPLGQLWGRLASNMATYGDVLSLLYYADGPKGSFFPDVSDWKQKQTEKDATPWNIWKKERATLRSARAQEYRRWRTEAKAYYDADPSRTVAEARK